MKIYFFNDKTINSIVYVGTMAHENTVVVPPQTAKIFEITVKDDQIPYLKQWDNCTLISTCDKERINGEIETISRT